MNTIQKLLQNIPMWTISDSISNSDVTQKISRVISESSSGKLLSAQKVRVTD